jgi:excisionase family DNA binding protein
MSAEDLARANSILSGHVTVAEILAYLQSDCYYSKKAATQYCGTGIKKIEEAISNGKLRAFTVGRKILIRKSDIDAWIQGGEVTRADRMVSKNDLQNLTAKALERAKATVAARRGEP